MITGLPQVEPDGELPDRVTIYEVGPRDGLQNEKSVVPSEVKAEFIRRLVAAGLETIETTSFVPPAWVPQLADASEVLAELGEVGKGPRRPVLVPNERGCGSAPTSRCASGTRGRVRCQSSRWSTCAPG
jgi:hydroxymethylglutaryl-CoA lyase